MLVQVLTQVILGEHKTPAEWAFIFLIGFQPALHPPSYTPMTQMVFPSCQIHLR